MKKDIFICPTCLLNLTHSEIVKKKGWSHIETGDPTKDKRFSNDVCPLCHCKQAGGRYHCVENVK